MKPWHVLRAGVSWGAAAQIIVQLAGSRAGLAIQEGHPPEVRREGVSKGARVISNFVTGGDQRPGGAVGAAAPIIVLPRNLGPGPLDARRRNHQVVVGLHPVRVW